MGAIVISSTGETLATDITWARSAANRARGLLARPPLRAGQALVLEGARQIHTFGMRYPLDVVYCDASWNVLHVAREVRPRRATRWVSRARYAIEFPGGSVTRDLRPGDALVVEE